MRSVERKENAERPPKLYDLTTLQREANRLFDYTAQQTLDYLQSLYEKRLATYPRNGQPVSDGGYGGGPADAVFHRGPGTPFMKGQPLPVDARPGGGQQQGV